MAEGEAPCRAAPQDNRRAGQNKKYPFIGLAVAAAVLGPAGIALGQGYPAAPQGLNLPQVPGVMQAPAGPGLPDQAQNPAGAAGAVDTTQAPATEPPWTITPAVEADVIFTDNVRSTPTQKKADVYTLIQPSIFAKGETPKINGVFSYSPQVIEHAYATDQNQTIQNLLTNGTLTAVKDHLFFDVNASIAQDSRAGGRGFGNASQIQTGTSTQTIAFAGSPYARFRFGDTGDAELRYRFSQAIFNGNTGAIADPTIPGQALGAISNSSQNEASARISSGDVLARTTLSFNADYQTISSVAALDSNHTTAIVQGSYALTNSLALLLDGGYEKLNYPHQAAGAGFAGNVSGATYHGGFRYQPRDDRNVTLTYGRTEGQNTFSGNMMYAVTPLTTLSGSYSQQTSSQQQNLLQNTLSATQTTPGQTINQQTGLPFSITNPNLALQNSVSHFQNMQLGAIVQGGERNHYSFVYNRAEETAITAGALSQTTDGVITSWTRDLSPLSTGVASFGYSTTKSNSAGLASTNTSAITAGLSFSYSLTETLVGSAGYSYVRQSGTGGTVQIDLLSVNLKKSF